MLEPIGLLAVFAGIAALLLPIEVGLTLVALAAPLAASAALILPGANIQPAHALLGFLALRFWLDGHLSDLFEVSLRSAQTGFWLMLAVVYSVLTAVFLPRIFAHQLDVFALNGNDAFARTLLGPNNGNITQSVYLLGDLVCFLIYSVSAQTRDGFRGIMIALFCVSVSNVMFAILDIVTVRTSTTDLLSFIRNAPYVIYVDTGIGDTKRIIGSYTEASAFASATVATFCFTLRLWLGHIFSRAAFVTAAASFILVLLSTSSTGYIALVPCVATLYIGALWRLHRKVASVNDVFFVFVGPAFACLVGAYVAFNPALTSYFRNLFDIVIVNKAASDSALQRGAMNWDALRVFQETFGLGAGLGSVRTSSFLLACIANVGMIGTVLQGVFLTKTWLNSRVPEAHDISEVKSAAWMGCWGTILAAFVSGALIDLGLPFYMFAALASAAPHSQPKGRRGAVAPSGVTSGAM